MTPAEEYLLLETYILLERAQGTIRAEAEAGIVDRMEVLWLLMSDDETAAADARALGIIAARKARSQKRGRTKALLDLGLAQSQSAPPRITGWAA